MFNLGAIAPTYLLNLNEIIMQIVPFSLADPYGGRHGKYNVYSLYEQQSTKV